MNAEQLPVVVIGAGPVGLAAAAHLLERGETPLVFEISDQVGGNIRQWGHVRMFSPWEFNVDRAAVALLEANGWQMPPLDVLPTGGDLLERYLLPLAGVMSEYIHLNTEVVAISRRNVDKMKDTSRDDAPFVIRVKDADGNEDVVEARAVIDASGTWHNPNPLGADGLPAIGERTAADHIYYGIPGDLTRYAGKRVMVVGSGHSAINALLDLVQLKQTHPATTITWVMRSANMRRIYGGGENDALPARGQLGSRIKSYVDGGVLKIEAPFRIQQIKRAAKGFDVIGESSVIQVDEMIAATGARPDLNMLRELRLALDSSLESAQALGPMIDPNIHSCGTVRPHGEAELRHPEKNFYIVGMKSYGRAPTFLLATGYEQVRSVVAALVGDWEAAREVHLNLPETGVCSTDLAEEGAACCGTPYNTGALVGIGSIPVVTSFIQPGVLQPVALQTPARACGCDDTCCGDGVRSTSCGCDSTCCS